MKQHVLGVYNTFSPCDVPHIYPKGRFKITPFYYSCIIRLSGGLIPRWQFNWVFLGLSSLFFGVCWLSLLFRCLRDLTCFTEIVIPDNYPAHSGDSFCSSDISLDDSTNFDHLDEATSDTISLQNLELQSQSHHSDNVPSSVANPIDKLYLMQNSYFSTEQ